MVNDQECIDNIISDGIIVGENNRKSCEIIFPDKIDKYISTPDGREYTTLYDLVDFENDREPHKLEMIRLDGYTTV